MTTADVPTIRDRITELRRVPASSLLANPKNWRKHPKAQAAAMRGVLAEIGYADALLARETPDGLVLIDGHLRAETTPDAIVPVLILDVTEAEADKILLTHDPLAAMAEADKDNLAALLASVQSQDDGITAMLEALAAESDMFSAGVVGMPGLADGDRAPFQQMTFTVSDAQAAVIKDAIAEAKRSGFDQTDNENSNGNALAALAEAYLAVG